MKLRYVLFIMLLLYLGGNAYYSSGVQQFLSHLIAHSFMGGLGLLTLGIVYIHTQDDVDAIIDTVKLIFGPVEKLRETLAKANAAPLN